MIVTYTERKRKKDKRQTNRNMYCNCWDKALYLYIYKFIHTLYILYLQPCTFCEDIILNGPTEMVLYDQPILIDIINYSYKVVFFFFTFPVKVLIWRWYSVCTNRIRNACCTHLWVRRQTQWHCILIWGPQSGL